MAIYPQGHTAKLHKKRLDGNYENVFFKNYTEVHVEKIDSYPHLDYYIRSYPDGTLMVYGKSKIDNVYFKTPAWGGYVTDYIDIFGNGYPSTFEFDLDQGFIPHCSINYLGADNNYYGDVMIINQGLNSDIIEGDPQLIYYQPKFKLWRGSAATGNVYGHPQFTFFLIGRGKIC